MVQPTFKVHDLKTGRVKTMSKTALDIAKKHGMDKHWEILPNADNLQPSVNKKPAVEPTVAIEEKIEYQDPIGEEPSTDETVKKSKRKSKTDNQ